MGNFTKNELDRWFVDAVLPFEPMLTSYLSRNWRNRDEIADLRQEVYCRAYDAAAQQPVRAIKPFLLAIARNLLIDQIRRSRIVSIETISQMEASIDEISFEPGCQLVARDELRRLESALQQLPPRCREAVYKRKIGGLSQRQIAESMQVSEHTVEKHLAKGVRLLANILHGGALDAAAPHAAPNRVRGSHP